MGRGKVILRSKNIIRQNSMRKRRVRRQKKQKNKKKIFQKKKPAVKFKMNLPTIRFPSLKILRNKKDKSVKQVYAKNYPNRPDEKEHLSNVKKGLEKENVQTLIDDLILEVRNKKKVSLFRLSRQFKIKLQIIEEWARILDERGVLELVYPKLPLLPPYLRVRKNG